MNKHRQFLVYRNLTIIFNYVRLLVENYLFALVACIRMVTCG